MAWTQRIIHGKEILISSEDVDLINGWRWRLSLHSKSYIKRETTVNKKDISIFLHVEIAKRMFRFLDNKYVDHINGNALDNRRENLRLVSPAQNTYNRKKKVNKSGYKGVTESRTKWKAVIKFEKKSYHLGVFENVVDAAKAYDKAAIKYFGQYAWLNFPTSKEI